MTTITAVRNPAMGDRRPLGRMYREAVTGAMLVEWPSFPPRRVASFVSDPDGVSVEITDEDGVTYRGFTELRPWGIRLWMRRARV